MEKGDTEFIERNITLLVGFGRSAVGFLGHGFTSNMESEARAILSNLKSFQKNLIKKQEKENRRKRMMEDGEKEEKKGDNNSSSINSSTTTSSTQQGSSGKKKKKKKKRGR